MVPQSWFGKIKLFSAFMILFLMLYSSESPVSASTGSSAPDSFSNSQPSTGTITVEKRFAPMTTAITPKPTATAGLLTLKAPT